MCVVSITIDALWASVCARGAKFPLASDACVVLNPQNSVLGWLVAASLCGSVFWLFLGTGKAVDKRGGHERSQDQLKVCRNLALGAEAVLWR